jgi:hypothetical protein
MYCTMRGLRRLLSLVSFQIVWASIAPRDAAKIVPVQATGLHRAHQREAWEGGSSNPSIYLTLPAIL